MSTLYGFFLYMLLCFKVIGLYRTMNYMYLYTDTYMYLIIIVNYTTNHFVLSVKYIQYKKIYLLTNLITFKFLTLY